ncbi:MAG: hypothetical protein LBM75_00050 [Myxococcales bacterium]|jgi:hypothetical protein|nr:hypothetical protein [Myxococcales bacterium]
MTSKTSIAPSASSSPRFSKAAFSRLGSRLFALLLGVGLTACGSGAELDVTILRATQVDSSVDDPFERVTELHFRVFHADTKEIFQDASANLSKGKVSLSDLPTGKPLKIRATGYANGEVVSWGESSRFKLPEGPSSEVISVVLTLRKVDSWSPVLSHNGVTTTVASLKKERAAHTATLFDDGRVLLIGGFQSSEANQLYVNSFELLDPASGELIWRDDEEARRAHHTALRLQDGTILVSGGNSSAVQAETGATTPFTRLDNQFFDQGSLTWSPTLGFPSARAHHQASLFGSGAFQGQVQFFGGTGISGSQVLFVAPGDALYDPTRKTFTDGVVTQGRVGHALVPILTGHYQIVVGGQLPHGELATNWLVFSSADAPVLEVSATPRLHSAAVAYDDCSVFAMGGFGADGAPLQTTHLAQFKGLPCGGNTGTPPDLSAARGQMCAVTLKNGSILAVGGRTSMTASSTASAAVDLFSASSGHLMSEATPPMSQPRYLHTCTLLDNGMLLVTGGIGASGTAVNTMEIYTPKPVPYPEWQ